MNQDTESDEILKSIFRYAESALKTTMLINGAASVALIAFLGNILARAGNTAVISSFSAALLIYVIGVLCSALATGAAYLCQYKYYYTQEENTGLNSWHRLCLIFVILSYAAFGTASFLCYLAFLRIPVS